MDEQPHGEASQPAGAGLDSAAPIDALRAAGAERFDPVGFRYIEALARRAASHGGSAASDIDARVARALAAFRERFDRARNDAEETLVAKLLRYPDAADELRELFAAGDFKRLHRFDGGSPSLLNELVARLQQHSPVSAESPVQGNAPSGPELKAVRQFRSTWSRLSIDRQINQALRQAPKNAGPINSHMLVLRSLALMRDISPDYLNCFTSYADTLLCLDRTEKEKPPAPKKAPAAKSAKK